MICWSIVGQGVKAAKVFLLSSALTATSPQYLDESSAKKHAEAAYEASSKDISAELLLGMAYVESRYQPKTTSRVSKEKRKSGIPRWKSPPRHVTGPYFCGVVQASAGMSWKKCLELRDLKIGYLRGAEELQNWIKFCKKIKSKDIKKCMLAGHGHGVKKAKSLKTTYPKRVLKRKDLIKDNMKSFRSRLQ